MLLYGDRNNPGKEDSNLRKNLKSIVTGLGNNSQSSLPKLASITSQRKLL